MSDQAHRLGSLRQELLELSVRIAAIVAEIDKIGDGMVSGSGPASRSSLPGKKDTTKRVILVLRQNNGPLSVKEIMELGSFPSRAMVASALYHGKKNGIFINENEKWRLRRGIR